MGYVPFRWIYSFIPNYAWDVENKRYIFNIYLLYLEQSITLYDHTCSLIFFFLETDLKQLENSAQIFNALSDIPGDIDDVDQLFNVCFS